jgi:WS/DGAT/MGAT family acyltransferase
MNSATIDSRPNGGIDFQPLSGQDRLFLLSETDSAHMHVGAAMIFDAGPLAKPARGIDFARIRDHIASRLRHIPRYRQRISYHPLPSRPHWIDDERFDLDRHVRHLRLPQPGNERQLKELCGQLLSQKLDRSRPLWEVVVVEGLQGGRFALVAKTHHCLVDGIGGVNLIAALLDPSELYTREPIEPWAPKRPLTAAEVLRLEALRSLEGSLGLGMQLRAWARSPAEAASKLADRVAGLSQFLGTGLSPAPRCPLNQPIGSQRRFEWTSFDLNEVKAVKNFLGGTINDVVLATVAGAFRAFLKGHRHERRIADLRALVPINMRSTSEAGELGNHISAYLVSLPVSVANPMRRYQAAMQRMQTVKSSKQAIGGQILAGAGVPLLATLMRFADRLKTFNVVVTNVPGPPLDLYLTGARLESVFPVVPLFVNQGLGIALFSYAGKLHFGLNADRDVLPDIAEFARALSLAFDELRQLCKQPPRVGDASACSGNLAKRSIRALPRPLQAAAS